VAIQLAGLDPLVRAYAEDLLRDGRRLGLHITITSVRRTWAFQEELYNHWLQCVRTGKAYDPDPALKCRYPANAPGDSAHQYGLAFDSVVEEGEWDLWNQVRAWHGWRVPEEDRVHSELPDWRSYVQGFTGPRG
jgi:LAS superfamily LD-carboxypeptidase LdcB